MKKKEKISKETLIYDTLRGMCLRLGVNERLPTVSQLCQSLETSCSTLDRVLRRLKAEQMIVCRQGSGIYVSPLMTRRTIGMVFPCMIQSQRHSPFWSLVLQAGQDLAAERGHELRVYFDSPSDRQMKDEAASRYHLVRDLEEGRVDGFLTICNMHQRQWLARWKQPIVVYNDRGEGFPSVCLDLRELIQLGIKALINAGCRRLGFITLQQRPIPGTKEWEPMATYFCEEMLRNGLDVNEEWVWYRPRFAPGEESLSAEEFGYHLALKLMGERKRSLPFDGLVISDDMVARGFLTGVVRLGREAEWDRRIATISNEGSSFLKPYEDMIHRVEISPFQIVGSMMTLLETAMNGQPIREQTVLAHGKAIAPASPAEVKEEHQRIARSLG